MTRRRGLRLVVAGAVTVTGFGLLAPRQAAAGPCDVLPCPPVVDQVVEGGTALLLPGAGAAGNILGSVVGALGGAVGGVAAELLDVIGRGIAEAVGRLFTEVSEFFTLSSSPQVTLASFLGEDGAYHQVAQLAAVLMVLFILLGVIQGVVVGDPVTVMVRTLRVVPAAALAIYGFPWLVDQLVGLVDAVCASLLPTGATLATIAEVYTADLGRFGLPAILLLLFAFIAGVVIYAELVVRAALVTLVVALAPLSFSAMVWPAARGAARKAVELVVALILSKLAIWVALAVGIGMFEAHAQRPVPGGQSFGQMIAGAAILAVAVFAPFVVWRLIPVVEAAAVAHGLSRMPSRAAMTAAHTATTFRFFGGGGKGGPSGAAGAEHPSMADLPSRSLAVDSGGEAGGGSPAAGSGGAVRATAGTSASGAAAAGAAAGPVVAATAEGARRAQEPATAAADAQSRVRPPRSRPDGWSFGPEEG